VKRIAQVPRPDWQKTVESQGLVYATTTGPDGVVRPYWNERAAYVFDAWEVDHLESVTEDLWSMCRVVIPRILAGDYGTFGLSDLAMEACRRSFEADPFSIYGRFDLRYDGEGPAQMYELNGDTPTGLIESSVAQWYWLQDLHPDKDQWNSLHDRLVARWRELGRRHHVLHVAHSDAEESGEEWMTAAYMRDTADQAGLTTVGITVEQIGWDEEIGGFVDPDGRPIRDIFKLYPSENMIDEDFAEQFLEYPGTRWIEPLWKVLLSNKALLPALWDQFPGHANLIPAYLDKPWGMDSTGWIEKPLHGREGDGMRWTVDGVQHESPAQNYGAEGRIYQQWAPPPNFDGNHPVIGSWVVDGHAAGMGIRESDGPITDYYARFVPHYIDAPVPGEDQRAAWLREDGVKP
jgi:glutathionylspermidine synthase